MSSASLFFFNEQYVPDILPAFKISTRETVLYRGRNVARHGIRNNMSILEKHQLKVPRCNTKIGTKAFTWVAPEIWNGIPEKFKTMNLDNFKSNMKTFLFKQAYEL